jgi:hypothetical protein
MLINTNNDIKQKVKPTPFISQKVTECQNLINKDKTLQGRTEAEVSVFGYKVSMELSSKGIRLLRQKGYKVRLMRAVGLSGLADMQSALSNTVAGTGKQSIKL